MVEYSPLIVIEQRFLFCYNWISIKTVLVHLISLNRSQNNHYHLMISFSDDNYVYYFVHISSIKAGT